MSRLRDTEGSFRMSSPTRVLIAGAGVAAFEATLALLAAAKERVDIELVAPETKFWYRPLAVAEPFGLGEVLTFDLPQLASAAGAHFTPGAVVAVEAAGHVARTAAGAELTYDLLVIATGATPRPAVAGALTFRGPDDTELIRTLLRELDSGDVQRVAVAVPLGAAWALPAYELALLIAAYAAGRRIENVHIVLVTPEEEPLQLFGSAASAAAKELLGERGITLHPHAHATEASEGQLRLVPDALLAVDRVVALPRLYGRPIDGIPHTRDGFIVVDRQSRIAGFRDVFAAGDVTSFPVKQGGIAAQQADAAAEAIAADLGAIPEARLFRPVLRGLLLTGGAPRYLRHEASGGRGGTSAVSLEPLWWPPAKIVGRHLAPFLARLAGAAEPEPAPAPPGAVPVEVELRPDELARSELRRSALALAEEEAKRDREDRTAGEIMSTEVLVVAPEDALGEIAERMRERDVGSALVSEFGRLIGILTSRDLLRAFAARVHPSEARAREWMTSEPITVVATTPLAVALQLMSEHAIHHLPVVEGERAVGIVGARQVARALAELARTRPRIGLGF
jgi:sulfide:quinone oxidoreductase